MATNLFEIFPKIAYTLDNGETEQVVVDIFKRIILSKEFQENSSYFDTYDILEGESPEEVSYRFYGTQSLHWLILMTNNIIDPRFEWPLSEENLIKLIESKYGTASDVFTINRAVNTKGYQVETYYILTEDSTHKNPKRLLFNFETTDVNTPVAYKDSDIGTDFQSNYEVEQALNESFRRIKVLKPYVVQDILTSYNQSINA